MGKRRRENKNQSINFSVKKTSGHSKFDKINKICSWCQESRSEPKSDFCSRECRIWSRNYTEFIEDEKKKRKTDSYPKRRHTLEG